MFLFEDLTLNWRSSLHSHPDRKIYKFLCTVVSFLKFPQLKIKFNSVSNNLVASDLNLPWIKVKPQSSSRPFLRRFQVEIGVLPLVRERKRDESIQIQAYVYKSINR